MTKCFKIYISSWGKEGVLLSWLDSNALVTSLAEPSRRGCGRTTVLGCSGNAGCGTWQEF